MNVPQKSQTIMHKIIRCSVHVRVFHRNC